MNKKTLYEILCNTYESQVVSPLGHALIIPSKQFKEEWRSQLASEGVKITMSDYNGVHSFFLRKVEPPAADLPVNDPPATASISENKPEPQEQPQQAVEKPTVTQTEPKPTKHRVNKLWTDADLAMVKNLRSQGVPYVDIARRLGRSKVAVESIMRYRIRMNPSRDRIDSADPKPSAPPVVVVKEPEPDIHTGKNLNTVREYLESALLLVNANKPKGVSLILKQALVEVN